VPVVAPFFNLAGLHWTASVERHLGDYRSVMSMFMDLITNLLVHTYDSYIVVALQVQKK